MQKTIQKLFIGVFLSIISSLGYANQSLDELLLSSEMNRQASKFEQVNRILIQAEQYAKDHQPQRLVEVYAEFVKYYLVIQDHSAAKEYLSKATALTNISEYAQAYAYYTQAFYYNFLDIKQLAIEHALLSLEIAQKIHLQAIEPKIYYILYGAYASFDSKEQAQKYAQKTIEKSIATHNYNLLANAYSGMATVMGYYYQNQPKAYRDSILFYLNQSAAIYKKHTHKVSANTYGITAINIADFYHRNASLPKDKRIDSIQKYVNIAFEVTRSLDSNNAQIQVNGKGLLAELAFAEGDIFKAEKLLTEAFLVVKQQKVIDYYTLISITETLSQLYQYQGNMQKALQLKNNKEEYSKQLYNQNQLHTALRLEAEFENKQIKQEIQNITQLAETRKKFNYLSVGISLLLIILLFLLIVNHKNKNKLQSERALRLEKEKQQAQAQTLLKEKERRLLSLQKIQLQRQVEMQSRLEKEEQARLKAEQELLRIKNEQMQKEALANSLQIERKNKILAEIKDKISKENAVSDIGKIIKNEKYIDHNLEQHLKDFQDIHPEFFAKINQIANQKLTPLDLKYCAYLYLGLSAKEISQMFNVAPKSIRMTKYRIKQKLQLDKDEILEEFLQKLNFND